MDKNVNLSLGEDGGGSQFSKVNLSSEPRLSKNTANVCGSSGSGTGASGREKDKHT